MPNRLRESTIAEAMLWLRTPYEFGARVIGAGVDCGGLLLAVYSKILLSNLPLPKVLADWHLHRSEEIYINALLEQCIEIECPEKGDIVAVKIGRVFAHGGIVVDWPTRVIHANAQSNVEISDFSIGPIATREMRFFSPKAFHE